jgi:hypothetical protein
MQSAGSHSISVAYAYGERRPQMLRRVTSGLLLLMSKAVASAVSAAG